MSASGLAAAIAFGIGGGVLGLIYLTRPTTASPTTPQGSPITAQECYGPSPDLPPTPSLLGVGGYLPQPSGPTTAMPAPNYTANAVYADMAGTGYFGAVANMRPLNGVFPPVGCATCGGA